MKRKMLAIGMAMISLTFTLSSTAEIYAQENVDTTSVVSVKADDNVTESWDGSTGIEPSETEVINGKVYYKIYTGAQLAYIEEAGGDWLKCNYVLASDISLNSTEITWDENGNLTVDKELLTKWTPIEDFEGDFDGAGHTIYGAYVDSEENAGIFASTTGSISNLIVGGSYIKGEELAGGIAGECGSIDNCHFYGYVYSNETAGGIAGRVTGNITNCTNYGVVRSNSTAGGITGGIGSDSGTLLVENCINNGNVFARNFMAGGIIGSSYNANISKCTNNGEVYSTAANAGGIAAYASDKSKITECTNNQKVGADSCNVGGIVGYSYAEIIDCINNGEVSSLVRGMWIGGIVGYAENAVSNCINNANVISISYDAGGIAGHATKSISNCINYGNISAQKYNAGGIAGITGDIISECINYGDINAQEEYAGGIVGIGETVINSINYGDVSSPGNYVGGVAGRISSEEESSKLYNMGIVTGASYVGGVVGLAAGDITKSYNIANVTGTSYVGGVAGSTKEYSYTGTVSASYYLKSDTVNANINGLGNVDTDEIGVAEAKVASFFPVCIDSNADPAYEYLGYADMIFFVDRMYSVVLDREADPIGRLNWVDVLKNGSADGASIAREFVLGEEFNLRGLTNEQFVDVLYQTFFNREADAEGKELWSTVLSSGQTRAYVLAQFVNSDEFTLLCESYGISRGVMLDSGVAVNPGIPQFVSRLYELVLGRSADGTGLYNNSVALYVKAETAESVAKNFFASAEYVAKNTDNATYVSDLYNVFMNRAADADGLAYWEYVLEQGFPREYVLSEFAKSDEFREIAASYGLE